VHLDINQDPIHVAYSSLNFRDIMLTTGKLVLDNSARTRFQMTSIGNEFAGIDTAGRRVMGLCSKK